MRAGWRGDRRGVQLLLAERGPSDLPLLDPDRSLTGRLVELDQQDLAGPVLVQGDGLRGAGVGVRDAAGLGLLRGVPVAEREVVEAGRGDLVGRDDDLVALRLAGDRDGAVDHADTPGRRAFVGRDIEVAERTVRGPLRREDRAVDDDVAGAAGGRSAGPASGPSRSRRRRRCRRAPLRSYAR